MGNLRSEETPRNPLIAAVAEILGAAFVLAAKQPDVVAAMRAVMVPVAPEAQKTTALTKKELAVAISKSTSSIDRFDREGAPHTFVGDHRRYDLGEYKAWLAKRGKKPTRAPKTDAVDVSDVVVSNGLRPSGEGQ